MKKAGLILLLIAAIFYFGAILFAVSGQPFMAALFPSAFVIGALGSILILIGVIKDRMNEKQEEDKDDLSKY